MATKIRKERDYSNKLGMPIPGLPGFYICGGKVCHGTRELTLQRGGQYVVIRVPGQRDTRCFTVDTLKYSAQTGIDVASCSPKRLKQHTKGKSSLKTTRDIVEWLQNVILAITHQAPELLAGYLELRYHDRLLAAILQGNKNPRKRREVSDVIMECIGEIAENCASGQYHIFTPGAYLLQMVSARLASYHGYGK